MARKRIIDTEGLYFKTELVKILGPRGLLLYIRLWALAEDWGGYEFNAEEIALRMGALKFTPKEVEDYCRKLIDAGKIIPYENNGRNYHWLKNFLEHQPLNNPVLPRLPLPEWVECEEKEYKSGKKYGNYRVITGRLPVGYQYSTSRAHTETEIETEKERKLIYAHQGCAFDSLFDQFWKVYPKKKDRKNALKAWEKLNPPPELIQTILTAVESQKQQEEWKKEKGKFIPYPGTWLNGRRWEDEIQEIKPTW